MIARILLKSRTVPNHRQARSVSIHGTSKTITRKYPRLIDVTTNIATKYLSYIAEKSHESSSGIYSAVLNFLSFNTPVIEQPIIDQIEQQPISTDSTQCMQRLFKGISPTDRLPVASDYIAKLKIIYLFYKESYETLESKQASCPMEEITSQQQLFRGGDIDVLQTGTLAALKEKRNIAGQLPLLYWAVDVVNNTNTTVFVYMVKALCAHPAANSADQQEQLVHFIKLIIDIFPDRLAAELKVHKIPTQLINQLIEEQNDSLLLKLWKTHMKKIKTLTYSQWCAVPNGLTREEIKNAPIHKHQKLGCKACIIQLLVPQEYDFKIKVTFSQEQGNGSIYPVFFNQIDLLFILNVLSQRVIYQDDNTNEQL